MNKRAIAVVLCLIMSLTACFGMAEAVLGGWTMTEDSTVTPEAQAALDKALEGFVGSNVEAVALLATQVVSGTNYCILCRLTPVVPNPEPHYALVYVYQPLEGDATLLTIDDINVGVWG